MGLCDITVSISIVVGSVGEDYNDQTIGEQLEIWECIGSI